MTKPNEPLTCSEVVERLPMKRSPAEKFFSESGRDGFTEMAYGFSDAQRDVIFEFADKFAEWRERRVQELEAFKRYVHDRLDAMGVPHSDPESEHDKAGCRIGGRLDIVEKALAKSEQIRKGAKHD